MRNFLLAATCLVSASLPSCSKQESADEGSAAKIEYNALRNEAFDMYYRLSVTGCAYAMPASQDSSMDAETKCEVAGATLNLQDKWKRKWLAKVGKGLKGEELDSLCTRFMNAFKGLPMPEVSDAVIRNLAGIKEMQDKDIAEMVAVVQ